MPASKKDIELWRLERFRRLVEDFPIGTLECSEEPDFLVHCNERALGIELTDLHRKTPEGQVPDQAREAMRHRVVARAQEIYESTQLPPVLASFLMDDRDHIGKSDVEDLAQQFAAMVTENVPDPNSGTELPRNWDDFRKLPRNLHKLFIRRFDIVTKSRFTTPVATWVATLDRKDLERALASKEPKVAAYRRRCNESWLVINADIESMSTWFELDAAILVHPFATSFDRVFLVQHFAGKVHELPVVASGA
jgi:hypothetical protein